MTIQNEKQLHELQQIVAELGALKYFPSEHEEAALVAVTTDVANMVHSLEEARWLVVRMRQLYNDWPGPRELRAVYCSEYQPADRLLARSEVYPDGFPKLQLDSKPALPPPCPECANSEGAAWRQIGGGLGRCECDRGRALAASDKQRGLLAAPPKKREPWPQEEIAELEALIKGGAATEPTVPASVVSPITQADVNRILEERGKK